LDGLICNAGIMALPNLEKSFGYELQFFTNHIGHFIFTTNISDCLNEKSRVVVLSSAAHFLAPKVGIDFSNLKGEKNYSSWTFYGQSKFANLVFAKELARKFSGSKKLAFAVHPGVINTNLTRHIHPFLNFLYSLTEPIFLKSIEEGAATSTFLAAAENINEESGSYFSDVNKAFERPDSNSPELGKKLWEESEKILADILKKI
jgi:NAD(P)-dependent dehydrogenase (short-subunit alcohol dehydrogenase family)